MSSSTRASLCRSSQAIRQSKYTGDIEGGKAFQGTLAGVLAGTALSLGVSTVKASFVAGVVAAFVALVPILGGIKFDDELEDEGDPGSNLGTVCTWKRRRICSS